MMTSTFPTSRTNSRDIKNGLKEIQHKKETLMSLEAALKKRMNEFKELCLKEGELTGQLPIDYPLQPREPIPQVRRRITRSHGNIPNGLATSSFAQPLAPPCPPQRARHNVQHQPNPTLPYPLSRPTSTNSSSSSTSTASSNTRSINYNQGALMNNVITTKHNNINNNGHHFHSNSLNLLRLVPTNKETDVGGGGCGGSVTNFQPFYEETKPFQMSDFYKYSSKHRQKINCDPTDLNSAHEELTNMVKNHTKSTRQLQDEVLKTKNSLKYPSCDDDLQPTVNIFEKSGQKLMEATARAIAGNPALAEKLNNILPNHQHQNYHNHHHQPHHNLNLYQHQQQHQQQHEQQRQQ